MLKVIRFIGQNLGKLEALHVKITAAYNLWTTIFEAIKPLLPATASPVAVVASAVLADEPAAPVARPDEATDADYMAASGQL